MKEIRISLFKMFKQHRDDFYWEHTDEPHATRRRQILGKIESIIGKNQYLKCLRVHLNFSQVSTDETAYGIRYKSCDSIYSYRACANFHGLHGQK